MPSTVTARLTGLTTSVAVKPPCRVITTGNITLAGLQTINGITVADGDRVLVNAQTSSVNNGIYVAHASAWQRALDFDSSLDAVPGTLVVVRGSGSDVIYKTVCSDSPVVFGTSSITFALAAFGDATSVNFTQTGTGAVARSVSLKLRDWVSVKDFGATGDGVTNDTTTIQAALDSLTSGGICYFPRGDYLISAGLRPKSGTTLFGDGYGSRVMCSGSGWALVATVNFGLVNVNNVNHVRVTGLRLYGTKAADQGHTPKLVYFETVAGLTIDHCWLEHTQFEGIWNSGTQSSNREVIIESNHFDDVGQPAGAFVGLPAIQLNCEEAVVANNRLFNVGTGIGASGARISITGNFIKTVSLVGIGTGDAGADAGIIDIVGNTIEFNSGSVSRKGIALDGGLTNYVVNVVGNFVRLIGVSTDTYSTCYLQSTCPAANFSGNIAEIQAKGIAFNAFGLAAGSMVNFTGNVVRVDNEAVNSTGFTANPNGGGNSITVRSSDNKVYGLTRANGSYAFDYNAGGGGTLIATMAGDITAEANVRCGGTNYGAGEWDNVLIFENATATKQALGTRSMIIQGTSVANVGTPANGTVLFVYDGTTASNPLVGGGTGCLAIRQNGAWKGL